MAVNRPRHRKRSREAHSRPRSGFLSSPRSPASTRHRIRPDMMPPIVLDALRIVDDTVAEMRADAEHAGRWNDTHIWVVSDHGHSQ